MEEFQQHISSSTRARLRETSIGMYTKQVLPSGRVRVTGGKRLKSSGAYSAGFGKHVAKVLKTKVTVPRRIC